MRRPVYLPKVETIYRVWIEWDVKDDETGDPAVWDVTERLNKLKCPKSVTWTDSAGACWNAQIVITGTRRDSVEKFAYKVLRLIASYKKHKIYAGAELRAVV